MFTGLLIGGLIAGGSAIVSGIIKSKAAKKAAEAQTSAADQALAFEKEQYQNLLTAMQPYQQAGSAALTSMNDLIGLNGAEAQTAALAGVTSGPEAEALAKQGEEAILQNAAATGGLRGGNTQGALAQFRPALIQSLINERFSQLGGIAGMGQQAAGQVGAGSMQLGQQGAGLITERGAAEAGGILGSAGAWADTLNNISGLAGTFFGGGGFQGFGGNSGIKYGSSGYPYGISPQRGPLDLYGMTNAGF